MAARTILADKGFAGRDFEAMVEQMGADGPDRKDELVATSSLGAARQ